MVVGRVVVSDFEAETIGLGRLGGRGRGELSGGGGEGKLGKW